MKQNEFTILMTLDSIEQAYIIKSLLESNGVACQIINDTAQSVLRFNGVMWGIRLLVLTSQVELANKILNPEQNNQSSYNSQYNNNFYSDAEDELDEMDFNDNFDDDL